MLVLTRVGLTAGFVTGFSLLVCGCRSSPAEPDGPGAASAAAAAAEAVVPLAWDAPAAWTPLPAVHGTQRAGWRAPKAGDAKAEAEITVFYFGTGSAGDVDKAFAHWSGEFVAPTDKTPVRAALEGAKFPGETLETGGKYTIGVGPHGGPHKRSPMEMSREHYRLVLAVLKTPDRGNWFFKIVGPEDAVASSREAFLAMVRAAH